MSQPKAKPKIVLELSLARAKGLFEILDLHIDREWSTEPHYKHYAAVHRELYRKLYGQNPPT